MPAEVKNEKSEDLEFSGALWPAGVFALHPGDVDHEFSALKWTAPKAGDYALQASFKDIAKDGAATVDLRLVKETADGSVRALWQGGLNLNGYGKEIEVEKIDPALLSFEQGESLYAIVGVGDGSGYGDSVAVQMTLTASDGVEYDASRDFSWERNPNGVWSYGWLPADSEPQIDSFTLLASVNRLLAGPIGRISIWIARMGKYSCRYPSLQKGSAYRRDHQRASNSFSGLVASLPLRVWNWKRRQSWRLLRLF